MATPRSAKLSGSITWSDGSLFQGFAVIGLVLPLSSGLPWPELTLEPNSPRQRLPLWHTIPIKDGVFNQALGLWFTNDINPPGSKYAVWYFDAANKRVGAPASSADFFTVSADPTAPTVYTLTVPTASTVIPIPGDV